MANDHKKNPIEWRKTGANEASLLFADGSVKVLPLVFLESYEVAIQKAIQITKRALKEDWAFECLDSLKSEAALRRLHDYELEDYLWERLGIVYVIKGGAWDDGEIEPRFNE